MVSLNPEKAAAAAKSTSVEKPAVVSDAIKQAIKDDVPSKPFNFSRRAVGVDPAQFRAHHVFSVPSGVAYERVLQSDAYRAVAQDMRPGDLIELRFEPTLDRWALLLVVGLRPTGADVRELMHRHFEDIAPASSIEELSGFKAEQTGINVWRIRREVDGQLMPGEFPTAAAARTAIAEIAPKFVGRGWAKSS